MGRGFIYNALLLSFYNLPSLHPLSFHEMIFTSPCPNNSRLCVSSVGSLYNEKYESVQKFALKICAHWDINYLGLLDMFNISNLETRRIYLRLTTFHKVVNGSFPPDTLLQYSPVRAT